MKMKVDNKRHASVVELKERDKAVQVVLQGHAVTAKHLSYLIPTGAWRVNGFILTGRGQGDRERSAQQVGSSG